ncbi:hypothetical protein BURMUCF1_A0986 [Burkholderia multivorans ATCC BAA-247]|nr:hypothetical protein BURMUCF1_A0986 [Burkholderia multivorans ATCC BAA-247]
MRHGSRVSMHERRRFDIVMHTRCVCAPKRHDAKHLSHDTRNRAT